jgi:hypothetical protein
MKTIQRPRGSERKCFEVLQNCGEMKLVACAGKSPEPHPLKAVVCLQVASSVSQALTPDKIEMVPLGKDKTLASHGFSREREKRQGATKERTERDNFH